MVHDKTRDNPILQAVRRGMGALSPVFPELAGALAERLFFTPPKPRAGSALPPGAERIPVRVRGQRLAAWSWGCGPAIFLVHGWGGRAAQLGAFASLLQARGFRAVAFDAPGHGASGRGMTSLVAFAETVIALAERFGRPHGVIAHSLGAPATALAARRGALPRRAVFLAPSAEPASWTAAFQAALDVAPQAMAAMQRRSEARLGVRFADLGLTTADRAVAMDLLVIHDRSDREVSWREGAAVAEAWAGARLQLTDGLGHTRLLRDDSVTKAAVDFVTEGACDAPPRPSGQAWLDRHLYQRTRRYAEAN